jgi:hypothetical protein
MSKKRKRTKKKARSPSNRKRTLEALRVAYSLGTVREEKEFMKIATGGGFRLREAQILWIKMLFPQYAQHRAKSQWKNYLEKVLELAALWKASDE